MEPQNITLEAIEAKLYSLLLKSLDLRNWDDADKILGLLERANII